MTKDLMNSSGWLGEFRGKPPVVFLEYFAKAAATALALLLVGTGCQTSESREYQGTEAAKAKPEMIVLHEGDVVRVSFPGNPSMNPAPQAIRRDGRITLPLIGEFQAAGLTPAGMEKELIKLYEPQLLTKEVTVAVESSAFSVYVTGAILRPGKILSDRPMTALEAIMEAGGFDYAKADLKAVTIIRNENGRAQRYTVNLKQALKGDQIQPFKLKPYDIVYVPERFSWF